MINFALQKQYSEFKIKKLLNKCIASNICMKVIQYYLAFNEKYGIQVWH